LLSPHTSLPTFPPRSFTHSPLSPLRPLWLVIIPNKGRKAPIQSSPGAQGGGGGVQAAFVSGGCDGTVRVWRITESVRARLTALRACICALVRACVRATACVRACLRALACLCVHTLLGNPHPIQCACVRSEIRGIGGVGGGGRAKSGRTRPSTASTRRGPAPSPHTHTHTSTR
jgi:hypothetical protein